MGRGCDFSILVLAFVFFHVLNVNFWVWNIFLNMLLVASCIQHERKDVGNQFVILLFVSLSINCDLNGCKMFFNTAAYVLLPLPVCYRQVEPSSIFSPHFGVPTHYKILSN